MSVKNKQVKIYALINKENQPFYIGGTVDSLSGRLSAHLNGSAASQNVKAAILEHGGKNNIRIIELCISTSNLRASDEAAWIRLLKNEGCILVNVCRPVIRSNWNT